MMPINGKLATSPLIQPFEKGFPVIGNIEVRTTARTIPKPAI